MRLGQLLADARLTVRERLLEDRLVDDGRLELLLQVGPNRLQVLLERLLLVNQLLDVVHSLLDTCGLSLLACLVAVEVCKAGQVVGRQVVAALATAVRLEHVRKVDALDDILLVGAEVAVLHQVFVGSLKVVGTTHAVQVAAVKLGVQDVGRHLATAGEVGHRSLATCVAHQVLLYGVRNLQCSR